jgi:glycosyltransferase involved in cell wall biosynthesis
VKIAILYDAVFPYVKGGGERRYYEIARRLSTRHDVTWISWHYWPGPARTTIDGVRYVSAGSPPALYGTDARRRMTEAALFAATSLPLLLRERFDVIDCASVPFLPLFSARLATRIRGGSLVATWFEFWDDYWLTYRGGLSGRAARRIERMAARLGDAQIAISRTTADRMASVRGGGTPVSVIEPGVDIDAVHNAPASGAAYDIVSAGRLNAQKNLPLLMRAIALLAKEGRPPNCLIIGDGPDRERLEALSRQLGIAPHIRFAGRIEDDAAYFAAVKSGRVFAWPSVAEGFGMALLEAMACGLPSVVAASASSATASLVEDGTTGIIAPDDPVAFAAALRGLLDTPSLAAMAAGAVTRAQEYSWDGVADRVEAVYLRAGAR